MLVLSRKLNQVIRIGDNIEIEVLQIKGGGVRLGIRAPREVSVVRQEIIPRFDAQHSGHPREQSDTPDSAAEEPPLLCDNRRSQPITLVDGHGLKIVV